MVIDFHTHIFPDAIAEKTVGHLKNIAKIEAYTAGTTKGLFASMEESGIACCVVQPVVTSVRQFDSITRFAYELNEKYGDSGLEHRLLSFGGIHPDSPDYKGQLRILAAAGFQGIKLHPDYQGVNFNDVRYKQLVSEATELGMTIMVHAGIDVGYPRPVHCTPEMAFEVISEVKPDKLVLAHYGGWRLWDEVEHFLAGENVYLDTAFTQGYLSEEQFLRILKRHGSDKILFATDSPWAGQRETFAWISNMGIPKEQLEQILHGNAERLLGMKKKEA